LQLTSPQSDYYTQSYALLNLLPKANFDPQLLCHLEVSDKSKHIYMISSLNTATFT